MAPRASRRALVWIMASALMIGLLGPVLAGAAGAHGCCARDGGCPDDMQQCRWMARALCCQESRPVAKSGIASKPAAKAALLVTPGATEMRWATQVTASPAPAPRRALCESVVLRL